MRRRIAMVVAIAVVLLPLGAGAVLAADQIIRCHGIPCRAPGNDNLVFERPGNGLNDRIYLGGGDDRVRAQRFTRDRDKIFGSRGFDVINVADGDTHDKIWGGRGNDRCIVDARSEIGGGCSVVRVR